MSTDGYYGDFESIEAEREAFGEYNKFRNPLEPSCVPCHECMQPMYEVSENPVNNVCESCLANIGSIEEQP